MKNQKEKILEVLTKKHVQTIKTAKLSNINGGAGDGGCIIGSDP